MDNQDNTSTNLSTNRPPTRSRRDGPVPAEQPTSTLPTGPSRSWKFWSTKSPFPHRPDKADFRISPVPPRPADIHPTLSENCFSLKEALVAIKEPLSTVETADFMFHRIEDPMVYADGEGYLAITVYVKHGTVPLETVKEVAANMKACLDRYGVKDTEVAIIECSRGSRGSNGK